MEMNGLGGITEDYYNSLLSEFEENRPDPFMPKDVGHRESQAYLRSEKIYKAWYRDAAMNQALRIMCNPRIRALVEMFILSPVTPEQAVPKLKAKEPNSYVTVESYKRFRHYFWNPELLSGSDWGTFLEMRDASHNEWLKLAVTARGPEGTQLLLWKAGIGVLKNLDKAKIFTDFRNMAYMKAKTLEMNAASEEDSRTILNYARIAKTAQEEINNSSDAVKDVLDSFNAFSMKRTSMNAPSVKQLTEGNFTSAGDVIAIDDEINY